MESFVDAHFFDPEDFEPVATNDEVSIYERELQEELEEETMLLKRFSNEIPRDQW